MLNVSTWDYLRGRERNIWHERMQALADLHGCSLVTISLDYECKWMNSVTESHSCGERIKSMDPVPGINSTSESVSVSASAALPLLYACLHSLQMIQVYIADPSKAAMKRAKTSGIMNAEGDELQVSTWILPEGTGGCLEDLCTISHGVPSSR